jgi:hypothetical protein
MLGVITIATANKSIALLFLIKPMIERVRLYSNENFPIAMVEHLRSKRGDGSAVSLLQNHRSLRGGTPSHLMRNPTIAQLIVGKRHCRVLIRVAVSSKLLIAI